MNGTIAYILSRNLVTSAVSGVKNVTLDGSGNLIIELNDGTILTRPFIDIDQVIIDPTTNHLMVIYSDGTTKDAGELPSGDSVFIGDTAPDHTKYKLWIDTDADGVSVSGSVIIDPITATTVIGSVYNGKFYDAGTSLETIIRDILTTYSKPKVTLGISPSTTIYDKVKDSLNAITIKANVTKQTDDISEVRFYVNGTLVNTDTAHPNGGQVSYVHNFSTPQNTTFVVKVEVEDTNGASSKVSAQTTINFINKTYYGYIKENTVIDETVIKSLNSTLKNSLGYKYTGITTPGTDLYHIVLCYPKSFGTISSIKDALNFEYIQDYTASDITVDGADYVLMKLNNPVSVSDFMQDFK